jgi:hypothetical protein
MSPFVWEPYRPPLAHLWRAPFPLLCVTGTLPIFFQKRGHLYYRAIGVKKSLVAFRCYFTFSSYKSDYGVIGRLSRSLGGCFWALGWSMIRINNYKAQCKSCGKKKQMLMERYAKVLHKGHLIGQCLCNYV